MLLGGRGQRPLLLFGQGFGRTSLKESLKKMNRLFAGIGIFALVFAPVGLVMACSRHGTNAGNDLNNWITSNMSGSETGLGAMGASGGQDVSVSGHGAGWAGHDVYWVNITLPDGSLITENGSSPYNGHDVAAYAEDFSGGNEGRKTEAWLANRGKEMIRDWFEDYEPTDIKLNDFAG